MTERKTLKIRTPSAENAAPELKRKGRGWEISEKRLDALHERARDMRRHPTEAHKVLAERFARANLGRYTFKRQAVIGSAIVDFGCHTLGMAIMIDEGEPTAVDTRRDKSLEAVGVKVMRIQAGDILENLDDVLARITVRMREHIAEKKEAARVHREANPNQHYSRSNRRKFDSAEKR